MRDPLYRVPVQYKLVLMFAVVCLLALGVGGMLMSNAAERSMNTEIEQRLEFQARAYATALNVYMDKLARRTEDFASDGHIRDLLTRLISSPSADEEMRLRKAMSRHLQLNKLPLVQAFVDITVVSQAGDLALSPVEGLARDSAEVLQAVHTRGGTWCSGLITPPDDDASRLVAVGTPLRSLDGKRPIGVLVSWIHPGIWVTSALEAADLRSPHMGVTLSLADPQGRFLGVARELLVRSGRSPAVEDFKSGNGLRVGRGRDDAQWQGARPRSVFSRSLPLVSIGWSVRVEQDRRAAENAVTRLQNRFLGHGIVLALLASLLLYFPIRFLARPLVRMTEAVAKIKEGDFSTRVVVASEDEIGELARGLNLMAEAVEERTSRLESVAADLRDRQGELRRETERLAGVISSMMDGLIVLDANGEAVLFNSSAQPLLDAVECENGGVLSHYGCALDDGRSNCLRCLFDPEQPARSCIVDIGASVVEVHSTRLPVDTNGRCGKVLVSRDISERMAEDERQIHRERLAVLGEVASVMAHELNNPLAAITMFTQMLVSDLKSDSTLAEKAEIILRNAASCKSTIRDLLDYATNAEPEVVFVDVHAVLEDVIRFLRPVRERADIELTLERGAESVVVSGDEVQVRQIFVNLIVNALQAIDHEGTIKVTTRNEGEYIEVDVTDSGTGVPAEAGEQIFKPFFSTKSRGEGTGLGLPTALRIAELQGGSLELAPGEGPGATFRVRLRLGQEIDV